MNIKNFMIASGIMCYFGNNHYQILENSTGYELSIQKLDSNGNALIPTSKHVDSISEAISIIERMEDK